MTTVIDSREAAAPTLPGVAHLGRVTSEPDIVALANARRCPACAYVAGLNSGYEAGYTEGEDGREYAHRTYAGRAADFIEIANARARADRPGPRDGDHPGGAVDWDTGRVLPRCQP